MLVWVHGFRGFPWLLGTDTSRLVARMGIMVPAHGRGRRSFYSGQEAIKEIKNELGPPISSLKVYLGDIHNIW